MANYKRTMRPGMLTLTALIALTGIQCNNADCEALRDELYLAKLEWEACKTHADCMLIGGNTKDCTGVFSCNLAINRSRRQEAERRILSLPEETADCIECASPNCPEGEIAFCEPVSHRCLIVKEILDGGLASVSYAAPVSHTGGRSSLLETGETEENAGAGGGSSSPFEL